MSRLQDRRNAKRVNGLRRDPRTGAGTLAKGERGYGGVMALDFTDQSVAVYDPTTQANVSYGQGFTDGNGNLRGPARLLTYTSPSNKLVMQSTGYMTYSAHNLILQSEDFSTTWVTSNILAFGSGSTVNATTAPDGTTTADLITPNTTLGTHFVTQTISVLGSQVLTIWIKPNGYVNFGIREQGATGAQASFSCTGSGSVIGTTTGTATSVAGAISAEADGWYKCTMTLVTGSTATSYRLFVLKDGYSEDNMNNDNWTPNGTSGQYWWGAHLYSYPAVTDYIRTTSAAVYSLPYEWEPSGGACKGMLVEEARTNLLQYNTSFSTSWWSTTGNNSTVTANQDTAPNGLTQMTLLADDSGGGIGVCRINSQFVTVTSGSNTISVYAKPGGCNYLTIQTVSFDAAGNGVTIFNLTTGAVSLNDANHTGETATLMSDGVTWRFQITFSTTTDLNGLVYIGMSEGGASTIDVPRDGTSSIYVWGAQLEAGSFPTSPIITYGSTATRAADNISIATSAFPHNSSAHALLFYGTFPPVGNNNTMLSLYQSSTDYTRIYCGSAGAERIYINGRSTVSGNVTVNDFASHAGETLAAGGTFTTNDIQASYNGASHGTDSTSFTMPTAATNMYFGSLNGSGYTCIIKKAVVLPRSLPDSELNTRTAALIPA